MSRAVDDDDLSNLGGERLISRRHMLAGMAPAHARTNPGSTAGAAAQPAIASPASMSRRPSVMSLALSASERFKKDESTFLSKGSPAAATTSLGSGGGGGGGVSGPNSPQWKVRERSDREELDRFLDSMMPISARGGGGGGTGGGGTGAAATAAGAEDSASSSTTAPLNAVDEQGAGAGSGTAPPRSPAPHGSTLSPGSASHTLGVRSHAHSRRPSYMQATQQELKRQAELREAALARERRVEEEKSKSTRRVQGVSASDLYQRQQNELEQRRLAALEKEEAERRAERNKLAAKFDAQLANILAPAPPATARKLTGPSAAGPQTGPASSYASGSQTSRAVSLGSSGGANDEAESASSSALQLQLELSRLEGVIRRDVMVAADRRAERADSSSDGSADDDDDDEADGDGDSAAADATAPGASDKAPSELGSPRHGRRKGIPSGASAAGGGATIVGGRGSRFHASLVPGGAGAGASAGPGLDLSPLGQARALAAASSGAGSGFAVAPVPASSGASALSAALHSPADQSSGGGSGGSDRKSSRAAVPAIASVADIYDPALLRRAGESNQPYGVAPSVTGLDFLLESTKFRDAQKRKQRKKGGGAGGAGGATGFGRMTAVQLERSLDQMAKKRMLDQKAADSKSNHAHAVQQAQAAKAAKRPFFPTLWRRITGEGTTTE